MCTCADCVGSLCGDGCCNGMETVGSCPTDCGSCNNDGMCDPMSGENCAICPTDCACAPPTTCNPMSGQCGNCGNGACDGGETECMCPADCSDFCGDGCCTGPEDDCNCSVDCGPSCGDGCCTGSETARNCSGDCGDACGDGCCTGSEPMTCPSDSYRAAEELDTAETAQVLRLDVEVVRTRLHRARLMLRGYLGRLTGGES